MVSHHSSLSATPSGGVTAVPQTVPTPKSGKVSFTISISSPSSETRFLNRKKIGMQPTKQLLGGSHFFFVLDLKFRARLR